MPGLSLGLGLGLSAIAYQAGGGGAPAVPGVAPTTYPDAPTVDYHVHSAPPTVDGSGRMVTLTDLRALADMVAVSGTAAPKLMTDGLGRKFLRINGSEAAAITNALTVASNRAFMWLMVGRVPHGRSTVQFLNPRFASYTSAGVNTAANGSISYGKAVVTSGSAPFLQAGSPAASTNATDCYKVIPGAQMQVMAVASRTTAFNGGGAEGGTRLYVNNDVCAVAQQSTLVSNYVGAIVGGRPGASNTELLTTDVTTVFDLYAMSLWLGEATNAVANARVAAAVSNYTIAQITAQVVNEGTSISDGIATTLGTSPAWSLGLASRLTEPGSSWLPANYRVVNLGTSGSQTSTGATRQAATNSIFSTGKFPGGAANNIVVGEFGRNDVTESLGKKNSAMLYTDIVTLGAGYLALGWKYVCVPPLAGPGTAVTTNVSPAGENTIHKRIEGVRPLLADVTNHVPNPQFLIDLGAQPGGTYAGLVDVLHSYDILWNSTRPFKTVTSPATNYPAGLYDIDDTHLPMEGVDVWISGGDTAAYGYGSVA